MHERYFTTYGDDFEVARNLRTMLVFGEHDLGQRAPFPRIDLILCRNVLIYFTPALQRRALQMFAFSLRSGGYLALGKSETISPLAEYFAVDQPRLKVYRRVGERALIPPTRIRGDLPSATGAMRRNSTPASSRVARAGHEPNRPSLWHGDHILLALPVGVVVVDRNYDIHFLNSEARRLLDIHAVAVDQDLIHLIHHYDPMQFRRAIDQALDTGQPSIALVSSVEPSLEGPRVLEIACSLVARSDDGGDAVIALVITEVTEREHLRRRIEIAAETQSRLAKSNDDVLAANEELTHTIAMLRSENEDLHVAAEEIQAATEEVETLNEELQASNEELETLNEEMQATVEELNTTNDDLQSRSVELHALAIEAELARKQLRMILDGVDAAVVVYNDAGGIELHNTAWDVLGIGDGLAGQLLDEAGQPLPDNELPSARASLGDRFSMTIGLRRLDDGVRWYRVAGEPMSSDALERLVVVTIQEKPGPH